MSGTRVAPSHPAVLAGSVAALIVVAAIWGAVAALAVPMQTSDGATTPLFLVPAALSALICAVLGVVVHRRDRRLGTGLLLVAAAIATYLALVAANSWLVVVEHRAGTLIDVLNAMAAAGYMLPITAQGLLLLELARRTGGPARSAMVTIVALVAVNLVSGAIVVEPEGPFASAQPPLAGLLQFHPAWAVTFGASTVLWMAAVSILPTVVLWRTVARLRGTERMQLAVAASAALLPPWTLLTCVLLQAVVTLQGAVDEEFGVHILALAFSLPFLPVAVALAWARLAAPEAVRRRAPHVIELGISAATGVLLLTLAAFVGVAVGAVTGFAPLPVAVLATATATVGLGSLRRRTSARLLRMLDPPRARAVALLGARDPADRLDPPASTERLVRTALEADVRFLLRLPGVGWVDIDGAPVPAPAAGGILSAVPHGEAVAAVVGDVDQDDVRSVLEECREAIAEAALTLAVRDRDRRLDQEQLERARSVREERRRLERDLHDGVQGKLVALALDLRLAGDEFPDPLVRMRLDDTVEILMAIVDELRSLANGRRPRLLAEAGLRAALDELVRSSPVPVDLSVPERRFHPDIETLGYLVVCEAVANALKHAQATRIEVEVRREPGSAHITVRDDGVGGADPAAGSGIRSITERVSARGGLLVVQAGLPTGTVVQAQVPCAS